MSKCHTASANTLSINTPPRIHPPDVHGRWFTARVISSLRLGCSRGVDMLAARGGPEGGKLAGWWNRDRGLRETKRGIDLRGRRREKKKSKWDKEGECDDGLSWVLWWWWWWLLPFPARSADCGWFQDGLSFSRNTTTAPKAATGGRKAEAGTVDSMRAAECWDCYSEDGSPFTSLVQGDAAWKMTSEIILRAMYTLSHHDAFKRSTRLYDFFLRPWLD